MSENSNAHASVTVTLEIQVGGGAWGGDCKVSQVHKQALDGVRNRLGELILKNPGIKIVGEMKVNMITHSLEGRV